MLFIYKEFILKILELFRKLYLVRRCEEKIQEEYFQDDIKTPVHLGIGGEAISVGVLEAFKEYKPQVFGTYRNHAIYLTLSEDLDGFFGELYGKVSGCGKGKAGSMHMIHVESGLLATSAVVATTIPVATGAALANKMKGNDTPVIVFFGDGAVEEGAFWESLNFASLHKLNIVFVCEDNELAIHALPETRRGFKSFRDIASTFDISFIEGDGSNVLEVFQKSKEALGNGPKLFHFKYFRGLEHVGPQEDFKFGYRQAPGNYKKELDPLWNIEKVIGSKPEVEKIKEEINKKIEMSVKAAKEADFPTRDELFCDVFTNYGE